MTLRVILMALMFPNEGRPDGRPSCFTSSLRGRYGVSLLIRVDQLPSAALTPGP